MIILITLLNAILSLIFLRNLLSYAHLWWVKEYRWDRMFIHLRTVQGSRFWWPARRIPPISVKTVTFVGLSLMLSGLFLFGGSLSYLFKITLVNILLFPITFILVYILYLPTKIYHLVLVRRAILKLRDRPDLLVIGITGSYGKTSTKDYLATILSSQYRVLKTRASKNSLVGVAEVILGELQPEHQIFVVEMGAYKTGEIAQITSLVEPQIGIITAINAQHQDLFGSLETTMQAKYELIQGLRGKKIAIFNADNQECRLMASWAKRDQKQVWLYSRNPQLKMFDEMLFRAKEIESDFSRVQFNCAFGKDKAKVVAKVVGEHQVSNILASLAGARAAGLTLKEAAGAAGEIRPTPKVMQIVSGVRGSVFIDDTFNNNPDAAKAALDVLAQNSGRKFLVFQPMIELGSYSQGAHEEIGECAAKICDEIILTNPNFSEYFLAGVRQVKPVKPIQIFTTSQTANYLADKLGSGDMVLFKGKEAELALISLLSKK